MTRPSAEAAHIEDVLHAAHTGTHDPDAQLTTVLGELDAALSTGARVELAGYVRRLLANADSD